MSRLLSLFTLFFALFTLRAFATPVGELVQLQSRALNAAEKTAYLDGHNKLRAKHGAKALTWNNNLQAAAQKWADKCQFKHSGGAVGAFGENLYAGTGTELGKVKAALASWSSEVKDYNPSSPKASHFTQMVWKSTTQIGCAIASCDGIFDPKYGKARFHVCEYKSPGNVSGQYGSNVQK